MRRSPFHERTNALNRTQLWTHWAGYLSAVRYDHSPAIEYFATRNAVALFDTSPLFKYRISGEDAEKFLIGVFTRDIRTCSVGSSQYTAWCDDEGYVLEDGLVLRVTEDSYLVTSAEPNLDYFSRLVGSANVSISDISDDYGLLAVQGPHSADTMERICPEVATLPYFGVITTEIAGCPVVLSRTGFTGDLGYEIWVPASDALTVWDSVMSAGADFNAIPMGLTALGMARLDAAMLLIDVDFQASRHAWTTSFKETPDELGLGWMFRPDDDRSFIGRRAIEAERTAGTTRWNTVGFALDPLHYESVYNDAGLIAPKNGVYSEDTHSLYDRDYNRDAEAQYLGYATSFGFSPMVKRHIGLAKLPRHHTGDLYLELMVAHRPNYVQGERVSTPFYNPPRKTGDPS